ncbi:hypothetical protein DV737_g2298, partial [Chaetothyriales sp. CBS 132003]
MNPELRQTLNAISHNFESANQAAQENIYTFTQAYIDPCLAGFKSCLDDCTAPCLHRGDNYRRRRARERSRGRAENFFDFYDDWDEDAENAGTMAWGDDELDGLLAGRGMQSQKQPERQRAMSYGTRARPKGVGKAADQGQDPTIIPGSSYLGFLEGLPWRIGQRVLRYRPSAANLQENPGGLRKVDADTEPLREDEEYDGGPGQPKGHRRDRSETANSGSTSNSLSSRGDLILSDEEEDAREIDDEFAITLGRRTTSTSGTSEDQFSARTGSSRRRQRLRSRRSTRTVSSKSNRSTKMDRSASQKSLAASQRLAVSVETLEVVDAPSSTSGEVAHDASSGHDEHLEAVQKGQEPGFSTIDGLTLSTMEIKPYLGVTTATPPDPPPPPGDVQKEHPP